ncbi:MAG: hypothetical protein ACR2P3_10350 [Geminicoccaceae bacterium]
MLSEPIPRFGDCISTGDWRRQAAHAFGDDAIQPMAKQFLSLLQSIYAASCQENEQRSMSVQFLSLEDDPFTDQLSELFAAFAAEQLGAPVCLMSFDTGNRTRISNYGMFTERHPLRGAPAAAISDARDVDLAERSQMGVQTFPSLDGPGANLVTVGQDPAERLGESIERERSQAALLVVNARPIGQSIESLMTSRKVEGVIMIIDAGGAEARLAIAARDKVTAVGGRMLGVVLKDSGQPKTMSPESAWNGLSITRLLPSLAVWSSHREQRWPPTGAIIAGLALVIVCFAVVASITKVPSGVAPELTNQRASSISRTLPEHDILPLPTPRRPKAGR